MAQHYKYRLNSSTENRTETTHLSLSFTPCLDRILTALRRSSAAALPEPPEKPTPPGNLLALVYNSLGQTLALILYQETQRNLRLISTRLKKQARMALDTHFSN
ncbi:uncharacterized protein LOC118484150 [Helianthus annuus]|uniref:uncharacterized protein LOC118484150 n=1 Tax=Helianthus annuus TaxID=4232 RepID=UPI001653197A|nr:uncharacterized protein LOC118484150 [Helianthus annuus]